MFSDSEIRQFSDAAAELYRPGLCWENFAARSFEFLSQMVPNEFVAFGSIDTRSQVLDIGFNRPVTDFPKAMGAFGELMGGYPLFRFDPSVNEGMPFTRSDFFSDREFRQLDIFAEVYQVLGIDNHCAVHVPTGADEIAFFGIERRGGPDFSDAERRMLRLGQTHLANARSLVKARLVEGEEGVNPQFLMQGDLTVREADVLTWIAEGKSNEEIAILLGIGLFTVKDHVKSIFRKIGAPNRLAAALWALRTSRMGRARAAAEMQGFVSVPTHIERGMEQI